MTNVTITKIISKGDGKNYLWYCEHGKAHDLQFLGNNFYKMKSVEIASVWNKWKCIVKKLQSVDLLPNAEIVWA